MGKALPHARAESSKDGSLLVRFRAGGLLEMSWHLFTWGDEVEIIKPKKLASMLRKQLEICSAHMKQKTGLARR